MTEENKDIIVPIWASALKECLEWAEEIAMGSVVEPNSANILKLTELAIRVREAMNVGKGSIEA